MFPVNALRVPQSSSLSGDPSVGLSWEDDMGKTWNYCLLPIMESITQGRSRCLVWCECFIHASHDSLSESRGRDQGALWSCWPKKDWLEIVISRLGLGSLRCHVMIKLSLEHYISPLNVTSIMYPTVTFMFILDYKWGLSNNIYIITGIICDVWFLWYLYEQTSKNMN